MKQGSQSAHPGTAKTGTSGSHRIDHAGALRAVLDAPIHNRMLDRVVGKGDLAYEIYLRTPELLGLQNPTKELVTPDELMFQIVHQTQELWMKLLGHEAVALVARLDADELALAGLTLGRMVRVVEALRTDIRVLDTLTPSTFLVIRRHLGDGSGQQSRASTSYLLPQARFRWRWSGSSRGAG